jgi:hypothetical protein
MYKKKEFHFNFNLPDRFKSRARTGNGQQMRFDITLPNAAALHTRFTPS